MAHSISWATRFERDFFAFLVQLLETVGAVPAIAHHLARLAHIAELFGELQQAKHSADNFMIFSHQLKRR
jgi:hypothetical protein